MSTSKAAAMTDSAASSSLADSTDVKPKDAVDAAATTASVANSSLAESTGPKKAEKKIYVDGDITMQDPERMFAFVNNEDWMVIQTNTFNKVMIELSELKK